MMEVMIIVLVTKNKVTPDLFVIGHDSDVVCVALFSAATVITSAAMTITTTNPWNHYDLYSLYRGPSRTITDYGYCYQCKARQSNA